MTEHASPSPSPCRNCGTRFEGAYCPECGQRDIDFRRDWRGLVGEFAASILNLDGKVPRGIYELLFRPGLTIKKFLEGKRASQIPPVRLYLFTSLVFFLWFATTQKVEFGELEGGERPFQSSEYAPPEDSAIGKLLAEKFQNPEAIQASFNRWLPRVFLLGIPLFALATRLLFRKRPFVYLEHVIISLQLQTFLLLWILLVALVSGLVGLIWPTVGGVVWSVLIWWMQIYPVLALRRVFELSWPKAVASTLALELLFFLMFGAGMVVVMALATWLS